MIGGADERRSGVLPEVDDCCLEREKGNCCESLGCNEEVAVVTGVSSVKQFAGNVVGEEMRVIS